MKKVHMLVVMLMLLFLSAQAAAYVLTDDFSGETVNGSFWTSGAYLNTLVLDRINHRIVMTQEGQEGTSSLSFGKYPITGDFDVRVDYEILTPRPPDLNNGNQDRMGLSAGNIGPVERVSDGNYGSLSIPRDGEVYLTDFQPMGAGINPSPGIIPTDLAVKLRLTQVGSTISGYYWNGTDRTLLHAEGNG